MIEVVTGEGGHPVVRRDGRWLASCFDPVQEARDWLARRTAFLDKVKCVFILGLGAGYHVRELSAATSARVIVIEPESELIAAVFQFQKFCEQVSVECVTGARDLRASSAVREAVRSSFVVLEHPASKALNPGLYRELAAQLNGRDWGSLTWQWQLREAPPFETTPRVEKTGQALSIYDLEQTELVQNSCERERILFKALRELVK